MAVDVPSSFWETFPPGFRFHPTDEELILYYLKKKICGLPLMDVVAETDVYKWNPEELPGMSKLKTGDRQWFYFSPRDRKYPNGVRSNRATRHGYWKATGRDRIITYKSRKVGVIKTLVFYTGRARSGGRTDWVMHEYTMTDDELKRCPLLQNYYALYKLYKKSGAGPKNGEQYGAPFREEDWVDGEQINIHIERGESFMQVNNCRSIDDIVENKTSDVQPLPPDEFEELIQQITDPNIPVELFSPVEFEQSTMGDRLLREMTVPNQEIGFPGNGEQHDLLASIDLTSSSISVLPSFNVPDITSTISNEQNHSNAEENFLQDYLEMNDLLGGDPTFKGSQTQVENLRFDDIDGLRMIDICHDAAMFLQDIVPGGTGQLSQQYMNISENGEASLAFNCHSNNIGNNDMINFQMQPQSTYENQISSQFWTYDQGDSAHTPTVSNQYTIPPLLSGAEGVLHDITSTNLSAEVLQNGSSKDNDFSESWLSSPLWRFVDTIPASPASASESPLISIAFHQMSSSGRVRTTFARTNAVTGKRATTRKPSGFQRHFLCITIFGAICAILWIFIS